jgi:hypothetical protein
MQEHSKLTLLLTQLALEVQLSCKPCPLVQEKSEPTVGAGQSVHLK